jgi:hypothetical protein|nr:MAG TPA: hypothetical protein [Caudoviricetes sp.]
MVKVYKRIKVAEINNIDEYYDLKLKKLKEHTKLLDELIEECNLLCIKEKIGKLSYIEKSEFITRMKFIVLRGLLI